MKRHKEHFTRTQCSFGHQEVSEGRPNVQDDAQFPVEAGCILPLVLPPSGALSADWWGSPVPWEMLLTSSGWEAGEWRGPALLCLKAWPKALPGLSAWEAAQDFLSGLPCLLDSAWLGGHLGDFASWDLCLCACWEAQMGVHKLIAHEYWKSPLTWTTWAAFIVLGRKSCRYTWSKVRPGSIPQTMAVARLRGRSAQSWGGWCDSGYKFSAWL